jgi:hypothetical protein
MKCLLDTLVGRNGNTSHAGLLRQSVLHRHAPCCNNVRRRLLIWFLKQSVNFHDPYSAGRGRHGDISASRVADVAQDSQLQDAVVSEIPIPAFE